MNKIHVTLPEHLDEFVREEAERQGFVYPGGTFMFHVKLILAACLIAALSVQPIHASNDDDQEQLRRDLETYRQIKNQEICGFGMPNGYGWLYKTHELRKQNIRVQEFARGILSDRSYLPYWSNAWYLLALDEHLNENGDVAALAQELVDFVNQETQLLDDDVFSAVSSALNILQGLVGPTHLQDENLIKIIVEGTTPRFETGNPLELNYWFRRLEVPELIGVEMDAAPRMSRAIIHRASQIAYRYVHLARNLSQVSPNPVFLEAIRAARSSTVPLVSNSAENALSQQNLERWQSGRFDLFAGIKEYLNDPMPFLRGNWWQ